MVKREGSCVGWERMEAQVHKVAAETPMGSSDARMPGERKKNLCRTASRESTACHPSARRAVIGKTPTSAMLANCFRRGRPRHKRRESQRHVSVRPTPMLLAGMRHELQYCRPVADERQDQYGALLTTCHRCNRGWRRGRRGVKSSSGSWWPSRDPEVLERHVDIFCEERRESAAKYKEPEILLRQPSGRKQLP